MSTKKIKPSDFPLLAHQDFVKLRDELVKIAEENSDIITKYDNPESYLSFRITKPIIDATFNISNLRLHKLTGFYMIVSPSSSFTNDSNKFWAGSDLVIKHFTNWIGIVKQFLELPYGFEDENEQKIYEAIILDEEDADTATFNMLQQAQIMFFLDAALKVLDEEEENKETLEIKEVINNLHQELPKATKSAVVKKLAKILSKGAKHSEYLGKKFGEQAMKYIFKQFLEYAHKNIDNVITFLLP